MLSVGRTSFQGERGKITAGVKHPVTGTHVVCAQPGMKPHCDAWGSSADPPPHLSPLPNSPYLSPGGRVPVQAWRALAGELRQWFVEDSLAVEGP